MRTPAAATPIILGTNLHDRSRVDSTRYVVLQDPKNMFGFQYVAPVLSKKLVAENGTPFTSTLNKVSGLLTLRAMIAMNKAVIVDKKSAATVASSFLKANGLK